MKTITLGYYNLVRALAGISSALVISSCMGPPKFNNPPGKSTAKSAVIPTIQFSNTSQSQNEGDAGTVSISVDVELSEKTTETITATYTISGTADGTDHDCVDSSVVIPAGSMGATINCNITSDTSSEPNETINFTLAAPSTATLGSNAVHTNTIVNDDSVVSVTFTAASQSGAENAGTMTITVQQNAVSATNTSIPFTLTGTATGGGTDYSITASPVTILAGATSTTITITVVNDTLDENDETVIVTMGAPTNASQGATTVHTATITDNDAAPTVTFSAATQNPSEAAGTATVTFNLSAASGLDVTVPYTVNGASTATGGGTDYSFTASPVTITAGSTSGSFTVTIVNDTLDEADETIVFDMGAPTNASQGATTTQTITIADNDATPTVTFSVATQNPSEADGTATVTFNLSAASGLAVSVPYTVNGASTATGGGTDYSFTASPVSIAAGSTSGSFTVTIVNDTLDEADETIVFDMGAPTNASQGATTTQTITIADNDATPTVTFTAASQSGAESVGTMTITAQLSAASGLVVSVPYTMTGTAAGAGTDYSITASPVSISAGSTSTTITITVTDDSIDEDDETVIVTMGAPTNASQGATTVHTATITDDDATPTVTFTAASQSGAESVGTMTITAQLSAASGLAVSVPYTMTGTATGAGTDYSITASPVSIAAGSTSTTITITVVDDALDEADETVIVTMGAPTNASQGATTAHTATITDNDATPTVTFSVATQNPSEADGTATVTFNLSAASGLAVSVPYTVNGASTATGGGTDYSFTASPVSIAAGSTSGSFTVTIVNDTLDEADETIVFDMGAPTNASQGATTTQTITIADNDSAPTVTFTTSSQSGAESVGTMTITAQLSAASSLAVSVPYTMTGTATGAGTDYSITASPVSISAGSTSTTITITVVDDALDEADETVIVTMGAPTNASQGATTVHTATITDNDSTPTVTFSAASQSIIETGGTGTITINLSAASGLAVSIPYTITGTATGAGTDYTITASPASIAAGATSTTITVTAVTDVIPENHETVIVTMGAPTNAGQGATTVHTVTITDNDVPAFTYGDSPWLPDYNRNASNTVTQTSVGTVTYAVNSGTLPTGFSLNTNTGEISGATTSKAITAQSVTIRATGDGGTSDRALSITVQPNFIVDVAGDGNDDNPGDGVCFDGSTGCTLRAAAQEMGTDGSAIKIEAGLNISVSGGHIDLGAPNSYVYGDTVGTPYPSSHTAVVDANGTSRVFYVSKGPATIKELEIREGALTAENGACIQSYGADLTLEDVEISGCTISGIGYGAGLHMGGTGYTLNLTEVTFTSNVADTSVASRGGGLYVDTGIELIVSDSYFVSNSAKQGGAVWIEDTGADYTITSSSFVNNSCLTSAGGAIYTERSGSVTNSTFSGNNCRFGAGIATFSTGTTVITNSTFYANTSTNGGPALYNGASTTITFLNNVFEGNLLAGAADSCLIAGTLTSSGYNLGDTADTDCNTTATGDVNSTAAGLGALAWNGGPTPSRLPPALSAPLDVGTNTGCPTTDQRGQARPYNTTCDKGAVERQAAD